jgi:hypothetical protein
MNSFENATVLPLSRGGVIAISAPHPRADRDHSRMALGYSLSPRLRVVVALGVFGTRRAEYDSIKRAKDFSLEIAHHGIFFDTGHAAHLVPIFVAGDPS